jgi:hypothetical protein
VGAVDAKGGVIGLGVEVLVSLASQLLVSRKGAELERVVTSRWQVRSVTVIFCWELSPTPVNASTL